MILFFRRAQSGFTLVEILTVIVVIALLSAILLPVLASSRRSSRKVSCLSNLRQIGIATALYAQDADGMLPYAANATSKASISNGSPVYGHSLDARIAVAPDAKTAIIRYVGGSHKVFVCADDFIPDYLIKERTDRSDTFALAYGTSYQYDEVHALTGRTLDAYPRPAENLLWYDIGSFHDGDANIDGLTNVLYADLHTQAIPWSDRTKALDEDP